MVETNVKNPNEPLSPEQEKQTIPETKEWSNDYALKVCNADFDRWASYRQQNHDFRFTNADQLFTAWSPQKTWKGTRIPRASIGVFLALQQEETLLANIMSALYPFEGKIEADPGFGTSKSQARDSLRLILQQLEADKANVRETLRKSFKSALLYGNGIIEFGWEYQEEKRRISVPIWSGTSAYLYDAFLPNASKRTMIDQVVNVISNRPVISHVDIRDFYIDPDTPGPDIQEARGCAVRSLVTRQEIASYRGRDKFNVPSDMGLDILSNTKSATSGDQSKQTGEGYRGVAWQPIDDYTGDPSQRRMELIRHYRYGRVIWILNRTWVMHNEPNPLGCLPFLNAFYVDYPGRFYGISLCDVIEPEQRIQKTIIESRLDELALTIHSPFVKSLGSSSPRSMLGLHPGQMIELKDVKDLQKIEWPNISMQAFAEVDASNRRAQTTTGINDMTLGAPASQGNSANRTATGVNTQAAFSNKRIGFVVENLESNVIEPMFEMLHSMNKKFLSPDQALIIAGESINPNAIRNADVRFRSVGARKMQTRQMVLQVMPQLMPLLLNPAFAQLLADQQGMAIDIKAILDDISDAMEVGPMQWFRQMDQNEMQAYQQNNPEATRMRMQQERLQAQGTMQESKADTELLKTVLSEIVKNKGLQKAATGYDDGEKDSERGS